MPFLYSYQRDAANRMHNGCILYGEYGLGKSRTALSYFFEQSGGLVDAQNGPVKDMVHMKNLYIITTARKRDTLEWEKDMGPFGMTPKTMPIVVDSWNNIGKYENVEGGFFIFDEQRVVGKGAWVKSFLKIAKHNEWVLLSATPGDTWMDYVPIFIANGFYKNRTEFNSKHVEFCRYVKFPKVEKYWNTGVLNYYRRKILVPMEFDRPTRPHDEVVHCKYNIKMYKEAIRSRFDPFKNEPMQNAASMCYVLRRIVNSDPDRLEQLLEIVRVRKKALIFYNYDYELNALKLLDYPPNTKIREWNGHKHEKIPEGDNWIYLVQYAAGAEGWNCTTCNTVIFYSQNYSYKTTKQAKGRIDRLNTPFKNLYYYTLVSTSGIDLAIQKALNEKKDFNESTFVVK